MTSSAQPAAGRTANGYRPMLRHVGVDVLTPAGWMTGTVMLPPLQGLADYISKGPPLVKLVSAYLPGRREAVPFFALQRLAMVLVVPQEDDRAGEVATAPQASLSVTFLLEHSILEGTVSFPASLRLSDFLRQQTGFVTVRDVSWMPHQGVAGPAEAPRRHLPLVLVNMPLVIGVEESGPRA